MLVEREEDDSQLMLVDFGLGAFAPPGPSMTQACGTITFTAPEVLSGNGYGKEVDCWSLGVILFLLVRGQLPFDGQTAEEVKLKALQGISQAAMDPSQPIWCDTSPECRDLIRGLLTVDPAARLTIQQAPRPPLLQDQEQRATQAQHQRTGSGGPPPSCFSLSDWRCRIRSPLARDCFRSHHSFPCGSGTRGLGQTNCTRARRRPCPSIIPCA